MNLSKIRRQFPILNRKINGKPLIYFDNASTTQKPKVVIDAITDYYTRYNANIHRGIYTMSQEATEAYETVRDQVQKFVGARYREEIIFTSGATEAINLVVWSWGHENIHRGDEILLSEMEHHSNIVPWQALAKKKGAKIKFIPVVSSPPFLPHQGGGKKSLSPPLADGMGGGMGRLKLSSFGKLLTSRTKIVSITHASNVLGTVNPVETIIRIAHKKGAKVLADAAQSAAHMPLDVQKLNCDFLVFSGHKILGPTGVGVLYGKRELLENMPPYQYGGHMIEKVTKEKTTYAPPPQKFEAGTAPIAEVIGLGAAIEFLQRLGWKTITIHDRELVKYALEQLTAIDGLMLFGPNNTKDRLPIFSFTLGGTPAHDIATLLDQEGIAVRSGHHCTQILHKSFGLESSTRASLYFYNTKEEVDKLIKALKKIQKIFQITHV